MGGCRVTYTPNQWNTGFTADVTIRNDGATAINGWSLRWTFTGNQTITSFWNAAITPTAGTVTATNADFNRTIAPGGTATFGFQANYSGSNAVPTPFTLNGATCTTG